MSTQLLINSPLPTTQFANRQDATLEVFASMFGISPIEVSNEISLIIPTNSQIHIDSNDGKLIGHGSIVNGIPGKFSGSFYFNNLQDLKDDNKFRLDCSVDNKILSIVFFSTFHKQPKGMFVTELLDNDKKFSGIFQFN